MMAILVVFGGIAIGVALWIAWNVCDEFFR